MSNAPNQKPSGTPDYDRMRVVSVRVQRAVTVAGASVQTLALATEKSSRAAVGYGATTAAGIVRVREGVLAWGVGREGRVIVVPYANVDCIELDDVASTASKT